MSKQEEIIKKLASIVANQQKIITKLAQTHSAHITGKDDAAAILRALPPHVSSVIERIEVHGNEVLVKFKPGQDSDEAFNAIQTIVKDLQTTNVLGGTSYLVKQVA